MAKILAHESKRKVLQPPQFLQKLDESVAKLPSFHPSPASEQVVWWTKRLNTIKALTSILFWCEDGNKFALELAFKNEKELDAVVYKWLIYFSDEVEYHKFNHLNPPYKEAQGEGLGGALEMLLKAVLADGLIPTVKDLYDLRKWVNERKAEADLRSRLQV